MPFPASFLKTLGLAGPAKLVSAVSTTDGFLLEDSTVTFLTWETVSQNDPIYNTETGVFTIQESGLYAVSVSVLVVQYIPEGETPPPPVASTLNWSAVFVYVNETDVLQRVAVPYNEGQGIFIGAGVLLVNLNQGDQLSLAAFINCPNGSKTSSSNDYNKINLFKL